jgi:hypothetical protein
VRPALLALVLVALGACGGEAVPKETLPVLAPSALPGLAGTTEEVGPDDLAADFGLDVAFDGFVAGRERVFQGESHTLDRVVSRTLQFQDAATATRYVEFVRSHVADAYGAGTAATPLRNRGRSGYLIDPAACACHRASPTLTAVVAEGPRVTYLEINGDGATRAALERLLLQAP